jgi:hypothetical protein
VFWEDKNNDAGSSGPAGTRGLGSGTAGKAEPVSVHFHTPVSVFFYNGIDQLITMNARNIVIAGFSAGALLFVLLFCLNIVMNKLIAYDIAKFGGMRPMDDPVMMLFFIYPFVVAFAAAYVFDIVYPVLPGSGMQKGVSFGILLLVIIAIPSNFAMYTSMDWPVTFYIGNLIWAVIGFILTGMVFARIWKT